MAKSLKLYSAVVLAMLFWSVSYIWTRVAIESFLPVTLVTLRLVIASGLMFVFLKLTGKFQVLKTKDLRLFLLLAFFEPFLYYVGETYGLTLVEPTVAAIIVSTIPLFAPFFAYIFLRERPGGANILGILISLVGVFLVIYRPGQGFVASPRGVALLFLAVFSAICYSMILKRISVEYLTSSIVFYQSLLALLFFIPTFFLTDYSSVSDIKVTGESLVALFMLSVFASVLAFVLFAWAVRQMGVSRANVFLNLIPVFTAILSGLILGEMLTGLMWLGIAIAVLGLFVSQWAKRGVRKKMSV